MWFPALTFYHESRPNQIDHDRTVNHRTDGCQDVVSNAPSDKFRSTLRHVFEVLYGQYHRSNDQW